MNEYLVSIIVPIYKVEAYLDRCVNSLVSQKLKDIEIILVDDESPDRSGAMCDEWAKKDDRIKVVHKKNGGLGYARNSGMEVATGQYVAFVDSDDYVDSSMYQMLYEECVKNNLDCIYSEFNVDDYPGFRVLKRPEKLYMGSEEIEHLRLDIVGAEPSYISGVKYHCSSCKGLYSLELIRKYGLKFHSEREYISEDMLFNLDFLCHSGRVKIVPWQFYHYCLNNASITHNYRPDKWKRLLMMLTILNDEAKYQNKAELQSRLKRTAIFYSMAALKQEKRRTDIGFVTKINEFKKIVREPVLRDYLKGYPISKLPIKWLIYTIFLKYKMVYMLYVIM